MKKDDDKPYPEGYEHLEKKVKATQERVQQLDEQIKHVPQNSKPQPVPRPPGFTQRRYFDRERVIANIEQQKADLKTGTLGQIGQEVREADPKIARQVRDRVLEELFPNPFRKMDVKERNKHHEKPKDIEQSQDYMDTMFSSQDSSKNKDEIKQEKNSVPLSERFSQGLKYSVTVNFSGPSDLGSSSTKNRDRDKGMDRE